LLGTIRRLEERSAEFPTGAHFLAATILPEQRCCRSLSRCPTSKSFLLASTRHFAVDEPEVARLILSRP
jgi:hypothetical protein